MSCCENDRVLLTEQEEVAMSVVVDAMIDSLAVNGMVSNLSMIRVSAALAAQTAGYYSALHEPFTLEQAEQLRLLKEGYFEDGVTGVAKKMKTIGSA